MKKKLLVLFLIGFSLIGCKKLVQENEFKFVNAEKYFMPEFKEVVGLLFYDYNDFEQANLLLLVGNEQKIESIIGKELNPKKVEKDELWLRIVVGDYLDALTEAKEKGFYRGSLSDARVVFVTTTKGYIREFNADEKVVYEKWMQSEKLYEDLKELKLIE